MKDSYVFFADGFEEVEAMSPVDVMRRAGMSVKTVSVTGTSGVVSAHGVKIETDLLFDAAICKDAEWLILPGGMPGALGLYNCKPLTDLLLRHAAEGKKIAAICAAPGVVLGQLGLLEGQKATCYPGFEELCKGAIHEDAGVVESHNFVTGKGPAFALPFAYKIVEISMGKETADSVAKGMLYKR